MGYFLFIPAWLLLFCCKQPTTAQNGSAIGLAYDMEKSSRKEKLPDNLTEISGLSWAGKKKIACVQDEKGNLYIYDTKKDKAKKIEDFGGKGDYEAVEVIGESVFVMQSDGLLIEIQKFRSDHPKIVEYDGFFKKGINIEGLGYDHVKNQLLVAQKDTKDRTNDNKRLVYSFDLNEMKYAPKPRFSIDVRKLNKWLLNNELWKESKSSDFRPSGLAVHPLTGDIYLISSTGRLLLILDKNGRYKSAQTLSRKKFKQPEGICFEPDGDMWISNEGRDKSSNLLKFKYKPQ